MFFLLFFNVKWIGQSTLFKGKLMYHSIDNQLKRSINNPFINNLLPYCRAIRENARNEQRCNKTDKTGHSQAEN